MNKKIVTIIGGGASGIMAAISCKKHNPDYEVFVLEKNFKLGRKILASGNGRCNLTNTNLNLERYHTSNNSKELIEKIFSEFSKDEIIKFFEEQNLGLRIENDGRIFPKVNQAAAVVKALEYELEKLKIKIEYNTNVISIKKENEKFILKTSNKEIKSDYVIIATGGFSYQDLGSTGDGYEFAKSFNHHVTNIFPSITALKVDAKNLKKISGVRQEALVKILVNGEEVKKYYEEILFTDYGLSGSVILQLSRVAIENLLQNKNVEVSVQFTSKDETINSVKENLKKEIKNSFGKPVKSILLWYLNSNLIENFLDKNLADKLCENVSEKDLDKLLNIICDTRFKVIGYKEWNQAQVTAGGIELNEIKETLESKNEKGLYFCGEVLDVDGDCGGFNLSWAWSSGYIAGILK